MAKERANNGGGSAATFPKRRRLVKIILGAYLLIAGCFYFGLWLGRYAESFSAATYHHHGAALARRSSNKCVNGPYILDQNSHLEGMGSTFQHRKYSLILAAAVNASWIGSLHNRHSKVGANGESRNGAHVDGPNFAHSYFGLGDPNCSMEDLKAREAELEFVHFERPKDSKGESFVATNGKYRFPSTKSLCRSVENGTTAPWMTSNTVIELKYKSKPRESYNYCLFNRRFRQRFARRQRERNVRTKGQDDLWIGVHFRWGDVAKWSSSIESPNKRAGGVGLSGYINEARFQLDKQRGQNKTITLHFFSEGDKAIFSKFNAAFPDAEMHINGDWRESLDLMTQSDVLIGGQSGFFVLASHLCDGCTVVTASPTNKKFRASSVERNLTNFRPVIGFSSRLADDQTETDVESLSSGDVGNATLAGGRYTAVPHVDELLQKKLPLSLRRQSSFFGRKERVVHWISNHEDRKKRDLLEHGQVSKNCCFAIVLNEKYAFRHIYKTGGTAIESQVGHRQVREDEYGNRLLVAAVRDPIDHFLSGWAECGARDKLLKADINGTYDERVFAWLNVARSYTWDATCVGHSLPQANFLLLRTKRRRKQGKSHFHPRVDLVGDMRELPQLLELAGFRYNETIETPNNATTTQEKSRWQRDKSLLSNRTIDALCKFLALDYYVFDFRPPPRCQHQFERDLASINNITSWLGSDIQI